MSTGVYAPDKAAAFPDRLAAIREGKQPYPVHLHFILSDRCELACGGCAYRMDAKRAQSAGAGAAYSSNEMFGIDLPNGDRDNNPKRYFPTALAKRVIDDCAAMDTRGLEFTGGGEPTAHPDFREIFEYALWRQRDCALITHGLRLNRFLDLGVRCQWVRVSVDAATPETYGAMRPTIDGPKPDLFQRVLTNLGMMRKARDSAKAKMVLGVGFVVQAGNWHEIYEATRLYREVGADNIRISGLFTSAKDAYHASFRERAEEQERRAYADFDGPDFKVHARYSEKLSDLSAAPDYSDCHYEQFTTYLGADTNLYRCCVLAYNQKGLIGSVSKHGGLQALWDSEEKRDKFRGFDARTCSACQFNDRNHAIEGLVRGTRAITAPVEHAAFV